MILDELITGLHKLKEAYEQQGNKEPVLKVNVIVAGMDHVPISYLPLTGITLDNGELCLVASKRTMNS